jgi:putative hydrolase of the HAD superfamily
MTVGRIPPGVCIVYFDAVGTLIHPEPSAADAYHAAGQKYGSRLDRAEVRRRFGVAFRREEMIDAGRGWVTDEAREEQRWRDIVTAVLADVTKPEECFRDLYAHFARPTAWRCAADAARVLAALIAAGYCIGIASNFDARLRGVVAGLPELAGVPLDLVISSECGWRKPAPQFFARLADGRPHEVLLIGDDVDNDLIGAQNAGMHALLLDPQGDGQSCLRALEELIKPR